MIEEIKNNKKVNFIGSYIALIFGIITLFSNAVYNPPGADASWIIILGSLAYISAKRRRLGKNKFSNLRIIGEFIAFIIIFSVVLTAFVSTDQLAYNHPLYYVLIPLWVTITYIIVLTKKYTMS